MPEQSKSTDQAVERQTHRFDHQGKVVEVSIVLAESEADWRGTPESRQPQWSAVPTARRGVVAARLFG